MSEQTLQQLASYSADYQPILDRLQAAFEAEYGPLFWHPKIEPSMAVNSDGDDVYRVGSVLGRGIPLETLNLDRYTELINDVLEETGFEPTEVPLGNETGRLISQSLNLRHAKLTVVCRGNIEFWVDTPVRIEGKGQD